MTADGLAKIFSRLDARPLRTAAAAFAALAILAGPSCRKIVPTEIDLEDRAPAPGAGISIDARLISDPEEIEYIFKSYLPDRGILPVLVAVRNDDTVPLAFYSTNSLDLPGEFRGFTLMAGDREMIPLHPAQVTAVLKGREKPGEYREAGKGDFVTGTMFMPLGGYFIYKEIRARHEYRPLIRASLYPARFGGMFDPIVLQPGEEISGYLYFELGGDDSPYHTDKVETGEPGNRKIELVRKLMDKWPLGLTLVARPCLAGRPAGSGAGNGSADSTADDSKAESGSFVFAREGGGPGDESPAASAASYDEGRSRGPAGWCAPFFRTRMEDGDKILESGCARLGHERGADVRKIVEFAGKSASVPCAEIRSDTAVCAVDFKRRSRVYMIARAKDGGLSVTHSEMPRSTVSVVADAGGYFSLTSDDFCRYTPAGGDRSTRYARLANGVSDIVSLGDGRMLVVGSSETAVMSTRGKDMFDILQKKPASRGKSRALGYCAGSLAMMTPGPGEEGDTLSFFDPAALKEICRIAFMGNITAAALHGEGALVLLEEGTMIDVRPAGEDSVEVTSAGFIRDDIKALSAEGGSFIAVRGDGSFISGSISGLAPVPYKPRGRSGWKIPVRKAAGS